MRRSLAPGNFIPGKNLALTDAATWRIWFPPRRCRPVAIPSKPTGVIAPHVRPTLWEKSGVRLPNVDLRYTSETPTEHPARESAHFQSRLRIREDGQPQLRVLGIIAAASNPQARGKARAKGARLNQLFPRASLQKRKDHGPILDATFRRNPGPGSRPRSLQYAPGFAARYAVPMAAEIFRLSGGMSTRAGRGIAPVRQGKRRAPFLLLNPAPSGIRPQ